MEKTCSKCGETKPLALFYRDRNSALGRRPECKVCLKKQVKIYQDKNREDVILKKRKQRVKSDLAHYYNYFCGRF